MMMDTYSFWAGITIGSSTGLIYAFVLRVIRSLYGYGQQSEFVDIIAG